MDNLENGTDPTPADTTTEEGQSTQETQPVDTSTPAGNGQEVEAGVSGNPWDTDARFKGKTAEDVYKSYKALESKLGSRSEESETLRALQEHTGMSPAEIKSFLEQKREQERQVQIQQNPVGYVQEELQELKSKIAFQEEERVLGSFITENPQYAPFQDKLMRLAMGLERDKSYEEIANEYFAPAVSQGQQDAYKKIEQKVSTQPTGAQSVPKNGITLEDMQNMSSAELEALLPKSA